jgi:hypothetical protein
MKKVLGALLIGVLALAVSAHAITAGKLCTGVDTAAGNLGFMNCAAAVLAYNFTDSISAGLGLNYNSYKTVAGVETSQTGISARVNYYLPMSLGPSAPFIGLQYSSDGAATATSIISLLLGGQVEVADGVIMASGLIPYSTATVSGVADPDVSINTGTSTTYLRSIFMSMTVELN